MWNPVKAKLPVTNMSEVLSFADILREISIYPEFAYLLNPWLLQLKVSSVRCQSSREYQLQCIIQHIINHPRNSICGAQPSTPAANNEVAELMVSTCTWDSWKSGLIKIKQCSDKAGLKQNSARG